MSTSMTTLDPLAVKLWSEKNDFFNPGGRIAYWHLFNRGSVFVDPKFIGGSTNRGDAITYSYTNKLVGIPTGEGGTLDGNTEALNLGYDKVVMNVTRIGVSFPNEDTIEQQRTFVNFPEQTRKLLPNRHFELVDTACFYHLAGAAPTSFTIDGTTWSGNNRNFVWGHNTPTAPSSTRVVRAGGVANDESLTSSNTFTLDLVDAALELADNSVQPVQRLDDDTFDLYVSPEQFTDLKRDATGAITWYVNATSYATGGRFDDLEGRMFKTMPAAGTYAGVNIYSARRVAYGVNSSTSAVITTVRRAVMVGKDALVFVSNKGSRPSDKGAVPLQYFDQLKDFSYTMALEARMVYGLKKIVPSNGLDNGVIVISTYAAPHTS